MWTGGSRNKIEDWGNNNKNLKASWEVEMVKKRENQQKYNESVPQNQNQTEKQEMEEDEVKEMFGKVEEKEST